MAGLFGRFVCTAARLNHIACISRKFCNHITSVITRCWDGRRNDFTCFSQHHSHARAFSNYVVCYPIHTCDADVESRRSRRCELGIRLRVPERLQYKIAVLVGEQVLQGLAPQYLGPLNFN